MSSISVAKHRKKTNSYELVFFQRCVPQAERDVPFERDVCFASDVRFAREDAEHITSLCAAGAIHHYGEAITSLFTNAPKCAIIEKTGRRST